MSNKFKMMLLAMATLGVVGCADKLTDDVVQSPEDIGGETGYLSFRIKSADTGGMTRAWLDDDTENGDYAEGAGAFGNFAGEDEIVNNVQANRVFFFDNDGKYHSSALLTLESKEGGHVGADDMHSADYAEIVYSTTVKRTGDRGTQDWPTQCLVVLNGRPSRLNALTVKSQEEDNFDMKEFLAWVNEDLSDTDADEEGETLGLYKYGNLYYFTMTNSVYLGKDDAVINATQIPGDNLKMTREEAAENPVTVYVERIMSKVEVGFVGYTGHEEGTDASYFIENENSLGFLYSFKDTKEGGVTWIGDSEDEDTQRQITLKGLITNWTINAVEYQTKLFKDLDIVKATEGTAAPITAAWTEDAGPFYAWNDFSHHRSYWAIDPHYNFSEAEYPTQFRTSYQGSASVRPYQSNWVYGKSEAEENGNDIFDKTYPWALDYKSFNAVVNKRKYKYCLENTFGLTENDEQGYKHMIMGSHVLIQARLLTEEEADEIPNASSVDDLEISDKYYFSDAYYDEMSYINSRVTRMNQILGANVDGTTVDNLNMFDEDTDAIKGEDNKKFTFENISGGLWVREGGSYKKVVAVVEEGKENCQIAATDVFVIAPAYVAKGDGKVTIALGKKNANGDISYGYDAKDVNLYYLEQNLVDADGQPTAEKGETNEPVQLTRNQLVSLIYQVAGTADCFKEGRMYYAIPIQHHLAKGKDQEYEYKYTDLNTADYGVVRNHWYKFTVNQILKPGIPVHNPDQPIIPNYDEEDRYIGLDIVILPWHVVDNGNVTLGK